MRSKQFSLNKKDYEIMIVRSKEYLIPLVLIYVGFMIPKVTVDGFQWLDFGLTQFEQGAIVLYILNRVFLAGQLFVEGKK